MDEFDDDFGDLYADVEVQASSAMHTAHEFSQLPIKKVENLENGTGNCCYNEFSMEPKSGILGNNGSSAQAEANELAEEEGEGNEEDVMLEKGDGKEEEREVEEAVEEKVEDGEEEDDKEREGEEKVDVGEEDMVEDGMDEDKWSDSEDELNIVLDDDDDGVWEKNRVSNDHVNKNEFMVNDHMRNRCWFDYKANEEVESCKNAVEQNCSRGRIGGGYNLQNKNMRLQSPSFPCESRANKSIRVASYSFKHVQDESEDVGFAHHRNASSLVFERGDNFSLPRSRTILDVNIDSLNDKPWRHPGADITDFFNFGFNENSWKQYCNHLNTSRYQMSGGRHSCKSFRHNKELKFGTEHEDESHKAGPEIIANPVQLESQMISGRAIQVEECVIERQPFKNRWGPLDRDSDVVIQIAVQDDLKEDCLNSAKEDVDQTEVENEDNVLGEAREFLCFSSASEDELSSVEGDDEKSGNSVLESGKSYQHSPTSDSVSKHLEIDHESGQIVDGDVVFRGKWTDAVPMDEEVNTFTESSRSDERRLVDAAPSVLKPHLNHGDQSPHSVTPPNYRSHSDYGYGTCAGFRKSSNKSKLNSPNSLPEARGSVLYGCYLSKDSKKYFGTCKPRDREFCSRSRSAVQPDLSYHGNKPIHMDGDASHLSAKEWFSDSRHSTNYQKHNGLYSYESKRNSYRKTSNPDYGDHKLPNYDVRDHYMKRPNWEGSGSEHDLGLNNREIMNGKKRHFVQKLMLDHKKRRKDILFDDRRHALQNMESQPHNGFRHWHSNSDCYLENEGGDQWKTVKFDWQSSKEVEDDDLLVQSNYEFRLTQGDLRNPVSSTVGIRDCVRHKGDNQLSYSRREVESSAWSSRRRDGVFNGRHDVQYAEYVDDKVGYTRFSPRDSQNLPHSICRQRVQGGSSPTDCMDQSHSRNRRNATWAERSCNNDRLGHYSSFDTDARMRNIDNQDCIERRDHEQYGESRWNDEHYKFEEDNEVLPGGACYPYKRDPSHKNIDPQNGHNLSGNHIKHMQSGRGRFRMTRGRKRGQCFQNSKFIRNDDYETKLPRFRSSVDPQLVGVDRKNTGRSFRGRNMCNARYEYIGNNNGAELKTFDDSDVDYLNKVNHHENFDIEARQKVGEQHVKFSSVEHNEFEDIEEGQILTEDLKERVKKEINSFEDLRQIRENKNFYHENTTDGNAAFKGHENAADLIEAFKGNENPKIRDILAKIERRRERFKQPIALKKDTQKAAPVAFDANIGTCNSNLQRPARKRRWDGTQHMLSNA